MLLITLPPNPSSISLPSYAEGYIDKKWWPELRLDLSLTAMASDFYLFYAMKDASPYLRETFDVYAQVAAKQLAVYMDAAIGGELRHVSFDGLKPGGGMMRSIARGEWRTKRQVEGLPLLGRGRNAFYERKWSASFGGPRWGRIADLLVSHLERKVSPTMFVDQALALQHNTGSVFNKVRPYWEQKHLKTALDANLKEDWETLVPMGSPWAVTLFTSWYREEDELVVQGMEHSQPRVRVMYSEVGQDAIIRQGDEVRVSNRARAKGFRGQLGKAIENMHEVGNSGHYDVKVKVGSDVKMMRTSNLIKVSDSTAGNVEVNEYIEYIEEGI